MEPKINKIMTLPKILKGGEGRKEEREGSKPLCWCFLHIGLSLHLVRIVASLSMALTGHKRKYKARKSMSMNPDAPWCECGQYKRQKKQRWV